MPNGLLRISLSLVFTLIGLICPLHFAQAQIACREIFRSSPTSTYGTLRDDFKHERTYSKELDSKTAIKNQCQLGTCHLHSWATSLESNHLKRTGEELQISMAHLTTAHWRDRIDEAIQAKVDGSKPFANQAKIALGATVMDSRRIIRKHGIIPEGVWEPRTKFEQAPASGRLQEAIVNRIAKLKWDLSQEISAERQHQLRERAEKDIDDLFSDVAGELPETFFYRGKEYSPIEFAKEKFPELFESQVVILVTDDRKAPTFRRVSGQDTLIDTNIDQLELLARSAIDKGESVYLSYEHNAHYVDKMSGIMSINAFNRPKNSGPMSRKQRALFNLKAGGHAVQIVGYDLDAASGRVVKWKIQNSWGEKAGDQGHYHMYSDYFRAFSRGVTFSAAAGVELPKNEARPQTQFLLPF